MQEILPPVPMLLSTEKGIHWMQCSLSIGWRVERYWKKFQSSTTPIGADAAIPECPDTWDFHLFSSMNNILARWILLYQGG